MHFGLSPVSTHHSTLTMRSSTQRIHYSIAHSGVGGGGNSLLKCKYHMIIENLFAIYTSCNYSFKIKSQGWKTVTLFRSLENLRKCRTATQEEKLREGAQQGYMSVYSVHFLTFILFLLSITINCLPYNALSTFLYTSQVYLSELLLYNFIPVWGFLINLGPITSFILLTSFLLQ